LHEAEAVGRLIARGRRSRRRSGRAQR
jgi:hypothetical protein